MVLPSFLNERMQLCMHAWAHACTWSVAGNKKMWFFWFSGLKIVLKPIISDKNQPKFIASCISFNLRHFSGQLIKIEEFYSNFSDSKFWNLRQWKSWFFLVTGAKNLSAKNSPHSSMSELPFETIFRLIGWVWRIL